MEIVVPPLPTDFHEILRESNEKYLVFVSVSIFPTPFVHRLIRERLPFFFFSSLIKLEESQLIKNGGRRFPAVVSKGDGTRRPRRRNQTPAGIRGYLHSQSL